MNQPASAVPCDTVENLRLRGECEECVPRRCFCDGFHRRTPWHSACVDGLAEAGVVSSAAMLRPRARPRPCVV